MILHQSQAGWGERELTKPESPSLPPSALHPAPRLPGSQLRPPFPSPQVPVIPRFRFLSRLLCPPDQSPRPLKLQSRAPSLPQNPPLLLWPFKSHRQPTFSVKSKPCNSPGDPLLCLHPRIQGKTRHLESEYETLFSANTARILRRLYGTCHAHPPGAASLG